MNRKKNPLIEFNQAKRAAILCLSDPAEYSPSYLHLALDRMIRALSEMTTLQLPSGKAGLIEDPELEQLVQSRLTTVSV
ncbi:MAG: hypothetical protein GYB65_21455 [Chloroflexi bacterium]|nr:hypothetical protein [Chloroflexota bacterium]